MLWTSVVSTVLGSMQSILEMPLEMMVLLSQFRSASANMSNFHIKESQNHFIVSRFYFKVSICAFELQFAS